MFKVPICERIEYSFLEYSILYQNNSKKVNEIKLQWYNNYFQ